MNYSSLILFVAPFSVIIAHSLVFQLLLSAQKAHKFFR